MSKLICFDTETTGVEPGSRMIELAAVLFDLDGVIDQFTRLVNPGMPLPKDALAVNQITADMLADAPDAATVLKEFFDWLPCGDLVAHYAQYDTGIISWEAGRTGIAIPDGLMVTCTCEIAKAIGETKNNKLVTLADHYALKRQGEDHRALTDALLCAEYYQTVSPQIKTPARPWHEAGHEYSYVDAPAPLTCLPEYVSKALPLTFSYTDAKDETTERTITPYGWAETPKGAMFHGHCHLRDARRTFRFDRIAEVMLAEGAAA